MSRNQSDNLKYQHIRYTMLVDPESNDIEHLLRGENITNLRQLKTLVRRPGLVLGDKTFTDENGEETTLSEEHVQELKAIDSFQNYCQNWYGPQRLVGKFDITTTTRDEFTAFIDQHPDLEDNPLQPDNELMIRAHALRTGPQDNNNHRPQRSRSTTPPPRRTMNFLLAQYNKEKRPLSDYTYSLLSVKAWTEFGRQLQALAHAHGVENVLDENYSPTPGSDEEEVFTKMKSHMYSVFVKLVKETKGLCIVKLHKDDRDAQVIYKELCAYYTGTASQMAIRNLDEMEESIIDGKVPKDRRQDVAVSMQKWKALVEEFNSIALIERYINESQQLVYLKRFISDVPELKDVNNKQVG